jgi:hypothetical protein
MVHLVQIRGAARRRDYVSECGAAFANLITECEETMASLFDEMDRIGDELRPHWFIDGDIQTAFMQVQKRRRPDLSEAQWLDLFAAWVLHHKAKLEARKAAIAGEIAEIITPRRPMPLLGS